GRPLPYPRGVSLGPTHHGPPLTPRAAAWNTGRLIASLTRPRRSLGALEQLETIAEGIAALEAAPAGNRDAVLGADTRALEPRGPGRARRPGGGGPAPGHAGRRRPRRGGGARAGRRSRATTRRAA